MRINKLTAIEIKTAGIGKHGDGGGLWLRVRPNGSRAWVFRYTRNGKSREMGLGPLESVSLATARELARTAREDRQAGRDPIAARRAREKAAETFRSAAEKYIKAHAAGWSNPKHRAQWTNTLTTYAYPVIGDMPVDQIKNTDVVLVLNPIWNTKTETASRLRGRIERVLAWAIAQGYRSKDNPAAWRGNLKELLPAPSDVRKVKHHAAMPWQDVPAFMVRLREQAGVAARALELAVLTAARSGEVRGATWEEIDLEAGTWTVPGERMKNGKNHKVPLSAAAVSLLEALPWRTETRLVFPSPMTGRALSDAAMGKVLKDLDEPVTAHGFRSSFRDWAAESTNFPREVAEQALAHTIGDKVEAAYRRGDLFAKRTKLMKEWAEFLAKPVIKAKVVPISEAQAAGGTR